MRAPFPRKAARIGRGAKARYLGGMHLSCLRTALVLLAMGAAGASGVPLKVMAIGDSLTEEYRFETPFSAPKSSPLVANTTNWVEILATRRAEHFSAGSYKSTLFEYGDLRNAGYKYNYGVPGYTSGDWIKVINADFLDPLRYLTRFNLIEHLGEVDAVVIFLGGNDLKSNYTGIFYDNNPPALMDQLVANLGTLHDFIRNRKPALPILIATAPDISATHVLVSHPSYQDPDLKIRARQRIAAMNDQIIGLATSRGATVIRIDSLTDMIHDMSPFHLNGTEFFLVPNDDNAPRHIFCHDGFHPASMAQAIISNLIIDGLNQASGAEIPPLPNRKILAGVAGLNPDQPYLDWAGGAGGLLENPDGDALPNLAEFLLGTSPTQADSPFTFSASGEFRFRPLEAPLRYASLNVEESTTLDSNWTPTPASRVEILPDGTWVIQPDGGRRFYRLATEPRP
jgi:lysophospholipase L1-like esterase